MSDLTERALGKSGLALAQMASTPSKLAMAGRRVRWAPEPLLRTGIVVPPDPVPAEGPVDLYDHYDRTRALTFGALIVGLMLFWVGSVWRPCRGTSASATAR